MRFKVSDIYMPNPRSLLWELHANDLLQGRVIGLSDSGSEQNVFAVIEVEGIKQPLIVQVSGLIPVSE